VTANVRSITKARASARDKTERAKVNNRTATTILVLVAVLVVMGLGATQSASSTVAFNKTADNLYFFKRQLTGVGIGAVFLFIASRVPYHFLRKLAMPALMATIGLLIAVLATGVEEGGATRWLALPGFTIQPSEPAKAAVVLALAYIFEKKHKLLADFGHFIAPVLAVVGVVGALVVMQPDLGTLIIIGAAAMAVILASEAPIRFVLLVGVAVVLAATLLAFTEDYRADRMTSFLDPYADPKGTGYQVIQGYYALGAGGVFGVGLGASRARWFYLPNAHTDFIFAIIGEETGLVGGLTVIALFVVLALAGWSAALRAPDGFGRMVAAGITAWLSFQALVNVGGVLGVIPITGIALPFVSFGSSALIISMAAIGVLVNIAQSGAQRKP